MRIQRCKFTRHTLAVITLVVVVAPNGLGPPERTVSVRVKGHAIRSKDKTVLR